MSGALFELEDFEETRVEWQPVWDPELSDFGWHWAPGGSSLPLHEDGTPISKDEWKTFLAASRCRDCGLQCTFSRGGGSGGRGFRVCDDCAQLDGAHVKEHRAARCEPFAQWSWTVAASCLDCTWTIWTERFVEGGALMVKEPVPAEVTDALIARHNAARWVSRWGESHELDTHDGLVAAQSKRRARFLARRETLFADQGQLEAAGSAAVDHDIAGVADGHGDGDPGAAAVVKQVAEVQPFGVSEHEGLSVDFEGPVRGGHEVESTAQKPVLP